MGPTWRNAVLRGRNDRSKAFTLLILCSFFLGACGKKASPAKKTATQGSGAPVPVVVAKAISKDVPVEISAIGNVRAFSSVVVRSRITGELQKVHFTEGDQVKAGDLLFKIDPRSAVATLQQDQANLLRDQAQYGAARLELARVQKLFDSSVASADDLDKAQAAFQGWESTLLADKAAVSNATLNVEFTEIRSPIDGRTGNLVVKEGNIIKAEDDPLVTINQIHPIYVAFSVPEENLPEIKKRMAEEKLPVFAKAPGATNAAQGVLSFIDNAVDQTTGMILLKATFDNSGESLWPGQFVETSLMINTLKNATVVPSQAVQSSQSGEFVFVVNSGSIVEKRDVELGINAAGDIVVSKGVEPGETVVIDGQMRLGPNSRVTIHQAAAKESHPNASGQAPQT